jgi:hypothetical protein
MNKGCSQQGLRVGGFKWGVSLSVGKISWWCTEAIPKLGSVQHNEQAKYVD